MSMSRADGTRLVLLAALWGASFLFTRLCAADFGPVVLVFLRVAGASALLLPLLLWQGQGAALRRHWWPLVLVGLSNTALPFVFFAISALVFSAGLSAIFNATSPLWSALIAWAWLGQRPSRTSLLGLVIGFAGVVGLGLQNASFKPGAHGVSPALAVLACVLGTVCYGFAANYTRRRLAGVPSVVVSAGSQLAASAATLLPALWFWPAQTPGALEWGAVAVLALACTGAGYVMYFKLIASAGAANAISVTFLVPAFAVLWGALFLDETLTLAMLLGCAVILLGTALATGLIRGGRGAARVKAAPEPPGA